MSDIPNTGDIHRCPNSEYKDDRHSFDRDFDSLAFAPGFRLSVSVCARCHGVLLDWSGTHSPSFGIQWCPRPYNTIGVDPAGAK